MRHSWQQAFHWQTAYQAMSDAAEYVLTGDRFEEIDCCEGVLNLNYDALPSSTLRLGIWGIVFHIREYPLPHGLKVSPLITAEGLGYLPAWSAITFTEVTQVDLDVAPYAPGFNPGAEFLSVAGKQVELVKSWQMPVAAPAKSTYGFDCVLDHPFGYCNLRVHASGKVILEFNPDLIVPFSQLVSRSHKVEWWENGRMRV